MSAIRPANVSGLVTQLTVGAGADNLTVDSSGYLQLHAGATVFIDELGDITRLKVQGTGIIEDNLENTIKFLNNADYNDYLYTNVQVNHDWKVGSVLYPHIHWWQSQAAVPNFVMGYRWQIMGSAKQSSWSYVKVATNAFTYPGSGTINQISGYTPITPPVEANEVSDIIQIRLYRDRTNNFGLYAGADPVNADVSGLSFDIHKEIDTMGSNSLYSKD